MSLIFFNDGSLFKHKLSCGSQAQSALNGALTGNLHPVACRANSVFASARQIALTPLSLLRLTSDASVFAAVIAAGTGNDFSLTTGWAVFRFGFVATPPPVAHRFYNAERVQPDDSNAG